MADGLSLGFDTSAAHCAAALVSGTRILAARHEEMTKGQAERLFPLLAELLAEAGVDWRDLSVVGVGTGPGNFTGIRIAVAAARGMDRATGDYMGMLATVMNALAVQNALEQIGVDTRVQSAIPMASVCEPFIRRRAERHLEKGRVVIFGAGAGMPFFSTDTVAAQRALETRCEVILMGKQGVDGVYDSDPKTNPAAVKFDHLTYDEYLARDLKVADATGIAMARDNKMDMVFFNLSTPGTIGRAVRGEKIGTLVSAG